MLSFSTLALLPCSFHLVFHATGHRLELAAACQREKELWLNAIRHARTSPASWVFEPVPTLNVSANLVGNQAPTRNSIDVPPVPTLPAAVEETLHHMPSSSTMRTESTVRPNRRQSVNGSSMRAFFMHASEREATPIPPTVLIRRASATRRAQTDRFLVDVLSQPLLAARAHAKNHDEVLFRDPVPPAQGNGIGVGTMAKNKLMARESVLVSKQCALSVCSSTTSSVLPSDNSAQSMSTISASDSVASNVTVVPRTPAKLRKKAPNRNSLGMLLTFQGTVSEREGDLRDSRSSTSSAYDPAFSPDSSTTEPYSQSQCSSASTSAAVTSPTHEFFPPQVRVVGVDSENENENAENTVILGNELEPMERPKRSRSLVDNVRSFFGGGNSSSNSPSPPSSLSSSRQASVEDATTGIQRHTLQIPGETNRVGQRTMLSRIFRPRGRSASSFIRQSVVEDDSAQAFTSGSGTVRPSLLSRSSSLLVLRSSTTNGKRSPSSNRLSSSSGVSAASHKSTPARLDHPIPIATASRLAPAPGVTSEASISKSIKYRLFPGSLVPLTPLETTPPKRRAMV